MRCTFSPLAVTDLEEIADYIARDNPRRALSFIRELRERCERLVSFPEVARLRPEISESIRLVPYGRYVVCYRLQPGEIRIERIVQGGRNLPDLFEH
ncbi:plasmid stabilization protein [Thiocystis minor]|uniref:type II toxin-antitoxin system RelE/ParE family toxin n=1 Tax=Thiocystis minor TaxID=61597 RepID=UPI00191485E1|nr:type II toxin-antitoxin system RelE/ParE family toxin [Thiocystis minor]MBK5963225.1 plasmid stabilization protein [Thiocystis minor]